MDVEEQLKDLMRERILVLDGAMGTLIQRHELSEAELPRRAPCEPHPRPEGSNEALNLTQPDIIRAIHDDYLDAGADIITTNTFNANAISLADYGLQDLSEEINRAAASLARAAADAATAADGGQAAFRRGLARPNEQDSLDLALTSTTRARATSPGSSWSTRTRLRPAA